MIQTFRKLFKVFIESTSAGKHRIEHFAVALAIILVGTPLVATVDASAMPIPTGPTSRTFGAGAYVVDMGQPTQTVANGLKPYGLVYDLTMNKKIPVSWAFSDTKAKDGIDFTIGAKSYSGSAFIIPAAFASEALPTINTWKGKGVVIDGPIPVPFSAPVYGDITSFPRVVLDTAKGSLAVPYYVKAEIPSTAYRLGDPTSLTTCDDMYVMPHADPTWSTHSNLATFNRRGGFIWAGCHSVSVLEGLDDPADADSSPNMNFLTTAGLIPYKSHAAGTPPFWYDFPSDPDSQFIGPIDGAQLNGSEQIYIPSKSSAWRPTTRVLAYDPTPAAADAANSGDKAATLIVGPGFGDPNNGYVMYEGGHSLDGTAPANVASMRAFLDFHLVSGIKAGLDVTSTVPSSIDAATTVPASAAASGGSGTYTYKWLSSCGGSFSSSTAASTMFTAPLVVADTPCNLKVVVTDGCGRVNFAFKSLIIKASQPADVALNMVKDVPKPSVGDVLTYTVTASNILGPGDASGVVVTDLLPSGVTLISASPTVGSYTNTTGTWMIGSLAFGESATLDLRVAVNAGTAGSTVTNTASVTSTSVDPSGTNNTSSVDFLVNRRPVASADTAATPESTSVSISLFSNDDVGDAPITISGNTTPTHGTIAVNLTSGQVVYTPTSGYYGSDSFTYTIQDLDGDTSTATVTISISNTDDPPVAKADITTTLEDASVIVDVLANDTDNDANLEPKSVSVVAQPTNGLAAVDATNGKITYTPRTNFTGVDLLKYQVCDETTPPLCAAALVTITVTPVNDPVAPLDDSGATPEDTPIVVAVLLNDSDVEGLDLNSLSVATHPENGGATVSPDRTIRYAPATNFSGIDTFTYNICDNSIPATCNVATVKIAVTPITDAPAAIGDSSTTPEDTAVVIEPLSNDLRGDMPFAPTPSLNAAPMHGTATVDPTSGKIMYVPQPNFHGQDSFPYRVCDTGTPELCSDALVTVVVTPVNDPVVASDDALVLVEDSSAALNLRGNDTDVDGNFDGSSLRVITPPTRGTVSIDGSGTGTATYVTQSNESGTDTFTYEICDTGTPVYCDMAVATITINPINDAPRAQPDSASTAEDTPILLSLLANDSDAEGPLDESSLRVVQGPLHGVVSVNPDGSVLYSPIADFNGIDTFTYQVCDIGTPAPALCDTEIDTITVTPVNDSPVAQPETVGTPKGMLISIAVVANDSDIDGNLDATSLAVTAQPGSGSASANPDGSILYTPTATFMGTVTVAYKVCDTGTPVKCSSTTATVVIAPLNHPPVGSNDAASLLEDQTTSIDVVSNDIDVDGNLNPTTVAVVVAALHGTTSVNSTTGAVTYAPTHDYNGLDTFTYRICDTGVPVYCATALVRLTIDPTNDAPVPSPDVSSTIEDTAITISVLSNDSDLDANLDPSSLRISEVPSNGTAVTNPDHTVTYTPRSDFNGVDTIHYSICDTGIPVECAATTLTVAVAGVTDPPLGVDDAASTPEDTEVAIPVLLNDLAPDGPLDGTSLVVLSGSANGTAVAGSAGAVTYTPRRDFTGTDSLIYSVCANSTPRLCTFATVTITVAPVNDAPMPRPDSATTPEDTPVALAILSNDSEVDNTFDTSIVSVTLPAAHGVVTIDPQSKIATYTPSADYAGTDMFTYEVCDAGAPIGCATAEATITVIQIPDTPAASDDIATTLEDTVVVVEVLSNDTSVDGPLDPATVRIMSNPAHGSVTINRTTGEITYTPASNYNGRDTLSYQVCTVSTPRLCDVAEALITVDPVNDAPRVVSDTAVTSEDTSTTVSVIDNDSDVEGPLDPTTVSVTANAAHGSTSVNPAGAIVYSPTNDFNGVDTFAYQVCDSGTPLACSTAVVSITVSPQPDAPVAKHDSVSTPEATPVAVAVLTNDTDPDANMDPTTLRVSSGPSHGTMVMHPITHQVLYTPTAYFNGSDSAVYQVCDSGAPVLCSTAVVDLTVTPVNDVPSAADDAIITPEDQSVDIAILENDVDPDPNLDPGSVMISSAASRGTVTVRIDGTVTYKPNLNVFGSDRFRYRVCDLGMPVYCDEAEVAVAVTPVNDAPSAVDDSSSTSEGTPVAIMVTSNDTDLEGPIDETTVSVAIAPSNGAAAADSVTGVVTYTPNGTFNGSDTFTYEVCDLGTPVRCDVALVSLDVSPVNAAPDAADDSASTAEDTSVAIDVLSNDVDSDTNLDPTSVFIAIAPEHGAANVQPDHSLRYTPATDYSGSDNFTYSVCDSADPVLCATAVVTVDISPINDPPTAINDSVSTPEDTSVVVNQLTNDVDVDGRVVAASLTIIDSSRHGSLVGHPNGATSYQPAADFTGTDSYTYEICDDGTPALCDTAIVNITVTSVNDPPLANDDVAAASAETQVDIAVLVNDIDVDANINPASVVITTQPQHGTAVANSSGTVTYSPEIGYLGIDTIKYMVCDTGTPIYCAPAQVTVGVSTTNLPPVAINDRLSTKGGVTQTILVLGNDSDANSNLAPGTLSIVGLPEHGVVAVSSETVIYVADTNYVGDDLVTYRVCDSGKPVFCATALIQVEVLATASPPHARDDIAGTTPAIPVIIDLLANDSAPEVPLDPSTVKVITPPSGGSVIINPTNGTATYSPDAGFFGSDTFTYEVCDRATKQPRCTSAKVTVIVPTLNRAPVALPDAMTTPEGVAVTVRPLKNDRDDDGSLVPSSLKVLAKPIHGEVAVTQTGEVVYTPTGSYRGIDTFTYEVCDSGSPSLCANSIVTITITPGDAPVVAEPDTATTTPGEEVTLSVLLNDGDADGVLDPTSVTIINNPPNGASTALPTGSIRYVPRPGFVGVDTFIYRVCNTDARPQCAETTVTITVVLPNATLELLADSATTSPSKPVTIAVLANDVGPIDPQTLNVANTPEHGVATVNASGSITYQPDVGFVGADSFGYEVCAATNSRICAVASVALQMPFDPTVKDTAGFTGTLFEDVDEDGIRQSHERGLVGQQVVLYGLTYEGLGKSAESTQRSVTQNRLQTGYSGTNELSSVRSEPLEQSFVALTDNTGRFAFDGLPPGKYKIVVPLAAEDLALLRRDARIIDLRAGQHNEDVAVLGYHAPAPNNLAFTGSNLQRLPVGGLAMLLSGGVILFASRRRRSR